MSSKRLAQVESVYHAVLGQPPDRRDGYLREACGDDDELRREVESLLRYEPEASSLFEAPLQRAMAEYANGSGHVALSAGQRVGTYLVGERLGAGGMGEVFRAHDTRLRRDVAIKVLPPLMASDRDRLARLEREARLLASLNHPNIAAIYGLETLPDSGAPALILELVPGDTLADRIAAGPLPPKVAFAYARQIVEALDAAHERGIVHRDLKPANVKVTPGDVIKVLDFGLARTIETPGGDHSDAFTATGPATREGVVMGTVAYMSPEQARGLPLDKRTDIWAFGCVLYEMLTGRAAFARATVPDTLAAVLEGDPDWDALPASLSPLITEMLKRCLEKPVSRRVRDIADVTFALEGPISGGLPVSRRGHNVSVFARRGPALLATCGLLAIGVAAGWYLRPGPNGAVVPPIRIDITPPPGTIFVSGSATISPDGAVLAFVAENASGSSRLWVRPIGAEAARELPSTEGAAWPFWSPDSRTIGFFASGTLRRIDLSGGTSTVICPVSRGRGGTWSRDDVIVFNAVNDGPLLRVAASGGVPIEVTKVDAERGENSHRFPAFLPDARHFLYFIRSERPETSGIYVGSLDDPTLKVRVTASLNSGIYAVNPDGGGSLVWLKNGALVAQPFDLTTFTLQEPVTSVANNVSNSPVLAASSAVGAADNGTLVYSAAPNPQTQTQWYARDGKPLDPLGPVAPFSDLALSPDGQRLAFSRTDPVGVWVMDLSRGVPTRLTHMGGSNGLAWSPNGRVAFSTGAPPNLWTVDTRGTAAVVRLTTSAHSQQWPTWSPDGGAIVFSELTNDLRSTSRLDLQTLWLNADGTTRLEPYLNTPFAETEPQFSPDGQWLAYTSDESGQNEVYLQTFPRGRGKWPVSSGGGTSARWRRDGKELFYLTPADVVMAVPVEVPGGVLRIGTPRALFRLSGLDKQYDVSPDGQRILGLAVTGGTPVPTVTLVVNWPALRDQ